MKIILLYGIVAPPVDEIAKVGRNVRVVVHVILEEPPRLLETVTVSVATGQGQDVDPGQFLIVGANVVPAKLVVLVFHQGKDVLEKTNTVYVLMKIMCGF